MEQKLQRRRDANATREAILAAAEDHFAKHGFSGARIDKIAEEAGYNRSLVCHQYFASKEDLYHAVIRCLKDEKIERLRQAMTPVGITDDAPLKAETVQTFIEEALRLTFNHFVEHPKLIRIMAWEAAEGWQTFNKLQSHPGQDQWSEETRAFIRRAQAEGIIRPDLDPNMLISTVMGCSFIHLLSIPRNQLVFPGADLSSPEALAHAREQIVNLVVHGIMVHPKETLPDATGL
jgi:AcrR family transcriptional regulator